MTFASMLLPAGIVWSSDIIPVSGEVSNPRRNIPIATLLSNVVLNGIFVTLGFLFQRAFGTFSEMYNFVTSNPQLSSKLAITPAFTTSIATYGASLTTNPILYTIMMLGPVFGLIAVMPANYYWTTRPFFAMAMDRYAPQAFAKISRFHSPTNTILWTFVLMILFTVITAAYPVIMGINLIYIFTLAHLMMGLSGTVMPFTRPAIWQKGFTWKIGPVPVSAISCLLSAGLQTYLLFTTSVPLLSVAVTMTILGIGAAMYILYSSYNTAKGIEVSKIFAELPPE